MRLVVVVLTLCSVLVSSAVFAQEKNVKDARAYFQKGKSQFMESLYSEAAASFRKAYELSPNWKIQYNLAQSEAAAKRHGLALTSFELYIALGGDDVVESRRQEVQKEIERLKKMVGYLEISAPEGAVILVDGVERGTAPLAGVLPVSGSVVHVVETRKADGETMPSKKVSLVSGKQTKLVFKEKEEDGAAVVETSKFKDDKKESGGTGPAKAAEDDGAMQPLKLAGWISLEVGAAALIAGVITGGLALSANKDVEEQCPDGCYDDKVDVLNRRDKLGMATNVLLPVGGVVAAAGAGILIFQALRRKGETMDDNAFLVTPIISNQTAGMAVDLRF